MVANWKIRGYAVLLVLSLSLGSLGFAQKSAGHTKKSHHNTNPNSSAVLWTNPDDLESRDLFYGCGSKDREPSGKMKFVGENMNGVNPKFDVRDSNGVRWGVKLGSEARPEVAATRLVWAVGYFTNEDYYVQELPVRIPRLERGNEFIHNDRIEGVRLKRHNKHEHKIGYWSWNQNPFAGTRELNGLKVMMEIINNTDLKPEHLVIYDYKERERRYFITDLGGTFGRAGAHFYNRNKGVLKDYASYPLIQKLGTEYVDFWYFKHVPRADAKWIGDILARLSDEQISDAFRAGGFSPADIEGYTKKFRAKINELTSL